VWREQRRFVLKGLKDQGFGRKSAESVQEEASALVDHILTVSDGKELLIEDLFNIPVVNVIWKMVAGKTFALGSEEGMQFVRLIYKWFSRSLPRLAQLPLLGRLLCAGHIKRSFQMFSEIQKLFEQAIEEHDEALDESDPRDLIDKYLIEVRSGRPGFTKQQLTIIIMDLFAAGSETSSTTLRWAVLFLVLHPEAQRRCQAELDRLGPARTPSLEDMSSLVYCQATVLEVLRLGCTAPGTLPHKTLSDLTIAGFTFPAGQILVGNFMSTHSDPQLWDKPEQFSPDRFLDDSETGLRETPHFFPFSTGRRVCPGESLARIELFLFLAILLKRCQLLPATQLPDPASCSIGLTRIPGPFHCTVRARE
jgi:cytochrome P450